MDTSPLPAKGFTFSPILGNYDHYAARILKRIHTTPTATRSFVYNGQLQKTMKLTAITERVVVELSVLKSVAEWYFFSCVYG